jgi:hypothetical protein
MLFDYVKSWWSPFDPASYRLSSRLHRLHKRYCEVAQPLERKLQSAIFSSSRKAMTMRLYRERVRGLEGICADFVLLKPLERPGASELIQHLGLFLIEQQTAVNDELRSLVDAVQGSGKLSPDETSWISAELDRLDERYLEWFYKYIELADGFLKLNRRRLGGGGEGAA